MSSWILVLILLITVIIFSTIAGVEGFASFINFNLCDKPVINHAPFPIYQWWESGPHVEKYRDCDQYRCRTDELNGYTARPGFSLSNGHYIDRTTIQQPVYDQNNADTTAYYPNSAHYCAYHSSDIRCPNHWLYTDIIKFPSIP